MSNPVEFESAARQDFGPTTSTCDLEPLLVHKLADGMSIPSVDVPAHGAMPSDAHSEPDSTEPPVLHAMDSRSADGVPHTFYSIPRGEDPDDGYSDATPVAASAIVHNIAKLPQSYTLNVDASVGNIATIQSSPCVSSSSQMLLLPTILATGGPALEKPLDSVGSPAAISQIIITSETYPSQRTSILPEANLIARPKPSKVQILSNISLPKTSSMATYSQQYVSGESALYTSADHVYKLSASVASIHPKHVNHSIVSKANYSNVTSTVISQGHIKSMAYTHTFPKGANPSKQLNKVNNGANQCALPVGAAGNNQCHILSRVVSGPKLAVQPGRKPINTFGKSVKNASQNTTSSSKSQSRSIKIIQQTSASKPEMKGWAIASINSKAGAGYVTEGNKNAQQKMSPTHKASHLLSQKGGKNEQRVVLQSPCGPVLISTAPISVSHHRPPHYVQSGTPSLRYVHNYVHQPSDALMPALPSANINQMSANQHLTAQILQSLSQPKLMLSSATVHSQPPPEPYVPPPKPVQPRRHISGDPSTMHTADDIIGMEEKPNLTEEIIRYTHDSLAFVMLDHTYALCAQKMSPVSTCSPSVITSAPPVVSPAPVASPPSPLKGSPTVITSTVQLSDFQTIATSAGPIMPLSPIATNPALCNFTYKPTLVPPRHEEDDAASAISSLDGRQPDQAGSDTETAPEGEEEGKTRCICDFTHDDGYMICCDRCGEWQHVDCMGIDRQNIPDAYQCELCQPRPVERRRARALQMRKREELNALVASDSDSSDGGLRAPGMRRRRLLTVTTYSDTSGTCVTTYNNVPPVPPPQPPPPPPQPKRIPVKRQKKTDMIRKGTKRKLTEKRVKRKKEMMMNRSKYTGMSSGQSGWHEAYEQAVTNHYSPELRAKIMKYGSKPGNSPNLTQAVAHHYCTTVPHAGGKILIATRDLKESTPIVELRGKYMLSTQHRPQIQMSSRAGGQKPGPFVFFYRLPKDNTQVCIDTRTYGNEARFVRRSCKYNAELQHCIVKGTLHVYIVSLGAIPDGTEITVPHDHGGGKQPCACGNPKHCRLNGFSTVAARKALDYPPREKRTRHRRSSSSSAASPPGTPTDALPERRPSVINTDIKSPIKIELGSPMQSWGTTFTDAPASDSIFKEEKAEPEVTPKVEQTEIEDTVDAAVETVKLEPKVEPAAILEPEVAEVKMEIEKTPIIAEECLASPVKETKVEIKKEEAPPIIEPDMIPMPEGPPPPKPKEEEKVTRSVSARTACCERATRSSRPSAPVAPISNQDSDEKTDDSQDKIRPTSNKDKKKMTREERKMEAIMRAFERMEKAEQRKQEVRERQSKRRESDPAPPTDKDADDEADLAPTKKRRQRKGRARTTSQNASRRRLNSADSDMVTSGDEAPTPASPPPPGSTTPVQTPVTPDVGLSSACLLVEAAVGPLESAFKLPKTKKTMANEWVGRSPEHTPYTPSYRAPLLSARSLESLVRVASTMIGDLGGGNTSDNDEGEGSPPRTPVRGQSRPPKKMKRGASKAAIPEQPVTIPVTQHSAKKRWLRQAISEESDSPTAESPPNEMVTPLKKRRLARESLSLDQPVSIPLQMKSEETSPTITNEDSPTKEEVRDSITRHCKMKSRYIDSMYGSEYSSTDHSMEAQNVFLNMNLKDPRDEKFNMDIRRIIGVPGTEDHCEDIPMPKTPEERPKPMDVNDNEFQHTSLPEEDKASKVTPMEIDTEISPNRTSDVADEADGKQNESQTDCKSSIHSNDTSGNSSPQRDEMDDIQKKIHSFHTENIQILKIRNKKPPKEKRKKVNLNFDLNMVDDQISIQLRTDSSPKTENMNGDIHGESNDDLIMYPAPDTIPLPPVESIPLPDTDFPTPDPRYIPLPEFIPLPAEPMRRPKTPEPVPSPVAPECVPSPKSVISSPPHEHSTPTEPQIESKQDSPLGSPNAVQEKATLPDENLSFSTRFCSTGLFSGIFNNMNMSHEATINDNVPHLNIINTINKNIIEGSVFPDKPITPVDELRNVQEILDRVNSMDANTSMILSNVLSADVASKVEPMAAVSMKTYCPRSTDPRLNPPPSEKPKPVRRKLSITEYLKRHKAAGNSDGGETQAAGGSAGAEVETPRPGEWSSDSSTAASRSPLHLDAAASAATEELELRLNQALRAPVVPLAARSMGGASTGEFDAQPTLLERQRENLSQRLRREFGLSLPEDEEARSATALQEMSQSAEASSAGDAGAGFPRPPAPHKLPPPPPRLDR